MFRVNFTENKAINKTIMVMDIYANDIPHAYIKAMEGRDISILSIENLGLTKHYKQ